MKHQVLVAAMLAVCVSASAQTQEKKVALTKHAELNYTVANDGKTKEGLYSVKNTDNNGVLVRGSYKDGNRAGTWYFFDSKEQLTMRYNYDQKKVLYLDAKALDNVKVNVLSDDATIVKDASVPLPLCPVDFYVTLIGKEIATNYNDPTNEGVTAEITAHIDEKGKAVYTLAYVYGKNKKSTPKVIGLNAAFPVEWVPSTYKDKTIPSEFTVYAKIESANSSDDNYRRFNWANE
ncbi:hypothetical protein HQ865_17050 [Mucilaginibacter mali]|uniref:DUF4412 domain-containing protein n=1 Tax=Mucilaginibacter mali TaxID=2740462 RepID=A0A7D4UC19_9SPHI|nr:hypothetical protein [Mucilaginibacter mali]QKJ31398.1 hypothetical protein HQ865_17050 [Mucilaginibacter mali]